jgi:hypothetical protein
MVILKNVWFKFRIKLPGFLEVLFAAFWTKKR